MSTERLSDEPWHCKQIPNGDNPLIVCERETLLAEVERLRKIEAAATNLIALGWTPPPLSELGRRFYRLRDSLGGDDDGGTDPA